MGALSELRRMIDTSYLNIPSGKQLRRLPDSLWHQPCCLWGKIIYSNFGAYGIGLDKEAFMGFRAYIENQTKVGPSYTELVHDSVIEFSA